MANSDQIDGDFDGFGDACDVCPAVFTTEGANSLDAMLCPDADSDGDGVVNIDDICPDIANPDQADGDNDGVGDVCDNCAGRSNRGQTDGDFDGVGDVCDPIPAPRLVFVAEWVGENTELELIVREPGQPAYVGTVTSPACNGDEEEPGWCLSTSELRSPNPRGQRTSRIAVADDEDTSYEVGVLLKSTSDTAVTAHVRVRWMCNGGNNMTVDSRYIRVEASTAPVFWRVDLVESGTCASRSINTFHRPICDAEGGCECVSCDELTGICEAADCGANACHPITGACIPGRCPTDSAISECDCWAGAYGIHVECPQPVDYDDANTLCADNFGTGLAILEDEDRRRALDDYATERDRPFEGWVGFTYDLRRRYVAWANGQRMTQNDISGRSIWRSGYPRVGLTNRCGQYGYGDPMDLGYQNVDCAETASVICDPIE